MLAPARTTIAAVARMAKMPVRMAAVERGFTRPPAGAEPRVQGTVRGRDRRARASPLTRSGLGSGVKWRRIRGGGAGSLGGSRAGGGCCAVLGAAERAVGDGGCAAEVVAALAADAQRDREDVAPPERDGPDEQDNGQRPRRDCEVAPVSPIDVP